MVKTATQIDTLDSCTLCTNNDVTTTLRYAKNVIWNVCTIISFDCNAGYYRNWTYQGCLACPLTLPSNSKTTSISSCALCNNNTSPETDRIAYCPFQCNIGYYSSLNKNYTCIRCSTPTCTSGYLSQLCSGGATIDPCTQCTYQLKTNQIWTNVIPCDWYCTQGYSLQASDLTCISCSAGRYKTLRGNQSCTDCAVGSFSNSATTCQVCLKGTYNSITASTLCMNCMEGKYTPMNASTDCISCLGFNTYPNSIASIKGSTVCTLCPATTPYSSNGVNCSLPIIPCPKGFYSPAILNNTNCLLCPIGTYCDNISSSYPKLCPFSMPFSSQPSISIDQCTSTNPFTSSLWIDGASIANTLSSTGCPSNTTSNLTISTIYQCTAMVGYYGNPGSPALECPYDYYCPLGSVIPIPCPSGYTTSGKKSHNLSMCTSYMAIPCRPGFYTDFSYYANFSTTPFCSQCPSGSYCPGDSQIMGCPMSTKYYTQLKSTSVSECQTNPIAITVTIACPSNTHSGTAVSLMQCRADAGYYYLPGSLSAIVCPTRYYCPFETIAPVLCPLVATPYLNCQIGQYPLTDICPTGGQQRPNEICQSCNSLPNNAYWVSNTDNTCPFCCANLFFRSSNVCNAHPTTKECENSMYMPLPPTCSITTQVCTLCPAQSNELKLVDTVTRNALIDQSPNTLSFGTCLWGCAPGYYGNYQVTQTKTSCLQCNQGFYKDFTGDAITCTSCPEGKYSAYRGSSSCIQCPTYSKANGLRTNCLCMAGTYMTGNVTNNNLKCEVCKPGDISSEGAIQCTTCLAGTYWKTLSI